MTEREIAVEKHLVAAWESYLELCREEGEQHPNDKQDFAHGIHECQKF